MWRAFREMAIGNECLRTVRDASRGASRISLSSPTRPRHLASSASDCAKSRPFLPRKYASLWVSTKSCSAVRGFGAGDFAFAPSLPFSFAAFFLAAFFAGAFLLAPIAAFVFFDALVFFAAFFLEVVFFSAICG